MEFLQSIKEPYQAVLDEKWRDMEKYYNDLSEDPMGSLGALFCPISVDRDTAFHLAVYGGGKQPLCCLLELVERQNFVMDDVFIKNIYGNTVLHEAAISGNLEARKDGASILQAAVQGEHFGTALELLDLDEELANLKYTIGTSLYMLSKIPSIFKRGRKMNIFKKLLYCCLPVGNDRDDDAENIEYKVKPRNRETNSGGNDNDCCLSKVEYEAIEKGRKKEEDDYNARKDFKLYLQME
ncbi:hypothetical protein Ddye_018135 [Dipteronia dyeriana]|uniref:Uncharacterized protein n=1 Tax=Dipteronia dyeriana TaxID=168575 RepID=A0AAD9UAI0_9ROSI|nr:hypothetical protein Ddye_018135 [Dipteronia dyeriana]